MDISCIKEEVYVYLKVSMWALMLDCCPRSFLLLDTRGFKLGGKKQNKTATSALEKNLNEMIQDKQLARNLKLNEESYR